MQTLTDRRFLVFCAVSALVGVLSAIWLFPTRGLMVYALPLVVLTVLLFADGYMTAS